MKTIKRIEAPGQSIAQRQTTKLQRHRVEEALWESKEGFRSIFDVSPDYIYLTDIEGWILNANAALLKRVGLSLEQMRQKRFMDFFAGDNPTEVLHAFAALKRGREVKGLEVRAKNTRGEIFEYEVNAVPLWEGEKVVAILSMARDVTAHKQAEEQLRNFHQQLRALAAHLQSVREGDSARPMRQHNPLLKILIADDHAVVRRGVRDSLADVFAEAQFGEAGNTAQVLALVRQQPWDILILDIHLPGRNGLEVVKQLKHEYPHLPVLALSLHSEEQFAIRALKRGWRAMSPKSARQRNWCKPPEKSWVGGNM